MALLAPQIVTPNRFLSADLPKGALQIFSVTITTPRDLCSWKHLRISTLNVNRSSSYLLVPTINLIFTCSHYQFVVLRSSGCPFGCGFHFDVEKMIFEFHASEQTRELQKKLFISTTGLIWGKVFSVSHTSNFYSNEHGLGGLRELLFPQFFPHKLLICSHLRKRLIAEFA